MYSTIDERDKKLIHTEQRPLVLDRPPERYAVEINTQIASGPAKAKRQQNAEASARLRQRRKQQASEDKNKILKLEHDKRQLDERIQWLTFILKDCQNERDKLQQIVQRMPRISETTFAGPSASRMWEVGFTGTASYLERNPMYSAPASLPIQHGFGLSQMPYTECPAQRRPTYRIPDTSSSQPQLLPSISGRPSAGSTGTPLPRLRDIVGDIYATRAPYESGQAHQHEIHHEVIRDDKRAI